MRGPAAGLLRSQGAWRLFWVGWALVVLLLLRQQAQTGRYQPVSTKPGLCLDTRTGQLHSARVAPTFLEEVTTWSDDKKQVELQRALTQ